MLLGAGGMRMWSATALAALRDITRHHGIPLIADEVLTGFGRTGPLFACEHAGVAPDLMCLSKGITGGFVPFGATLATEELFAAFRVDDRTQNALSRTLIHRQPHRLRRRPGLARAARREIRRATRGRSRARTARPRRVSNGSPPHATSACSAPCWRSSSRRPTAAT